MIIIMMMMMMAVMAISKKFTHSLGRYVKFIVEMMVMMIVHRGRRLVSWRQLR